jgi:chorismate dehydratase
VHSVLLFTPGPLQEMTGKEIAITGESATSINLLKIIFREFCGIRDVLFKVPVGQVEDLPGAGRSCLLIGDRALRAARSCPQGFQVTDLGALWHHFTGMPFVFALWILRRQAAAACPGEVARLADQLEKSRAHAFRCLPEMARELSAKTGFPASELEDYWRCMSYDLTAGHIEGLRLYFSLCHKHGLLSAVPELHFFPDR